MSTGIKSEKIWKDAGLKSESKTRDEGSAGGIVPGGGQGGVCTYGQGRMRALELRKPTQEVLAFHDTLRINGLVSHQMELPMWMCIRSRTGRFLVAKHSAQEVT